MSLSRRGVITTAAAVALGAPVEHAAMAQDRTAAGGEYPTKITYATIMSKTGTLGLGVRTSRGVLDVAALEKDQRRNLPLTMEDVIGRRGNLAALAAASGAADRYFIPEKDVKFGPVVSKAPKIFCVGLNYREHVGESVPGTPIPTEPVLFSKFNSCLNSHGGTIPISQQKGVKWDYEAELVMIIGRGGRNISSENALSHVFGYCSGNDFTERARQRTSTQWLLGKSGDGWGPLGPWLLSADQVDPQNLTLKCIVNGEVRQNSHTSLMIFDCKALIKYISEHWDLEPGDVIFTGTCSGVISGYPPEKQVWLKPGDKIVTSIEKLGDLEFTLT